MIDIIKQKWKKIKYFFKKVWDKFFSLLKSKDFFYQIIILFVALSSFLLGRISEFYEIKFQEKNEIKVFENQTEKKVKYFASKKGKYYYLPWCFHGSEKNKLIFNTEDEAKKAGYLPSKYCDGL